MELSGNIVRSPKSLSVTADVQTCTGSKCCRAEGTASRTGLACSELCVSGEGANRGEGGDIPSSMLRIDITLAVVLVVA